MHRHVRYTKVVLEEGDRPLPRCPQFDMFIPCEALNRMHLAMGVCDKGEDQKRKRKVEE